MKKTKEKRKKGSRRVFVSSQTTVASGVAIPSLSIEKSSFEIVSPVCVLPLEKDMSQLEKVQISENCSLRDRKCMMYEKECMNWSLST